MTREEIENILTQGGGGVAMKPEFAKTAATVILECGLKLVPNGHVVIDPNAELDAHAESKAISGAGFGGRIAAVLSRNDLACGIEYYIRALAEKQNG